MSIVPFSLKDAPSFIERTFPAQRVSIEAQTERKANAGQTLTALGSYWKGRKPLVLVRACVLGSLLPATDKPEKDLEVFELLMAMDDDAFVHRVKKVSKEDVEQHGGDLTNKLLDGDGEWKVKGDERKELLGRVLSRMPYAMRLDKRTLRPEELPDSAYDAVWDRVNAHLGTEARSHTQVIEQLGVMRFGHRPKVADTFCGGGSIPFEAARIGCDAYGSDLNPIACMLTWGSLNIVGGAPSFRAEILRAQALIADAVDQKLTHLKVEHDAEGNRAKALLYCVEITCPETGWSVPVSTSWLISTSRRCVAKLRPDLPRKRFDIDVVEDASDRELEEAKQGTFQNGHVVYTIGAAEHRVSIKTIRGDRTLQGVFENNLRPWDLLDVGSKADDIFRERVYCVQWMKGGNPREIFYRAFTKADAARQERVEGIVRKSLPRWQAEGLVPDMPIETGVETARLLRERGWTYWHHFFTPSQLLILALVQSELRTVQDEQVRAALQVLFGNVLDKSSRRCRWRVGDARPGEGGPKEYVDQTFYDQALSTHMNYGARLFPALKPILVEIPEHAAMNGRGEVRTASASENGPGADIFVTDPPYADAVRYEEITEFFIGWFRKAPAKPFADWVWDSRRARAITGDGEDFRREMVRAYQVMTSRMPDNGLQVVMFTHQDAGVWADMAGIFWGAGLRVTSAWYIATETSSELKKGGYVQGTVILTLRKLNNGERGFREEIVNDIRREVAHQIQTLVGLNQVTRPGRDENLFTDADLQMAGYAAALHVLTSYTHIDGTDMTREALRPRTSGATVIDDIIDYAVQIANEYLVPEGLDAKVWDRLKGSERFYLRMLDIEAAGGKKLDNYQNFAKAFKVKDYAPLMASVKPNESRLKSAMEFKKGEFSGSEFAGSTLRAVLFALYELQSEVESDVVHSHLRDNVTDYLRKREDIVMLARYLDPKLACRRPEEAEAARVLVGLVKNEKIGG